MVTAYFLTIVTKFYSSNEAKGMSNNLTPICKQVIYYSSLSFCKNTINPTKRL